MYSTLCAHFSYNMCQRSVTYELEKWLRCMIILQCICIIKSVYMTFTTDSCVDRADLAFKVIKSGWHSLSLSCVEYLEKRLRYSSTIYRKFINITLVIIITLLHIIYRWKHIIMFAAWRMNLNYIPLVLLEHIYYV